MEKLNFKSKKRLSKSEKCEIVNRASVLYGSSKIDKANDEIVEQLTRVVQNSIWKNYGIDKESFLKILETKRIGSSNQVRVIFEKPSRDGEKSNSIDSGYFDCGTIPCTHLDRNSAVKDYINLCGESGFLKYGDNYYFRKELKIQDRYKKSLSKKIYKMWQMIFEKEDFCNNLMNVLNSCRTIDQALERIPNLSKFCEKYTESKDSKKPLGTALIPADMIKNIDKIISTLDFEGGK